MAKKKKTTPKSRGTSSPRKSSRKSNPRQSDTRKPATRKPTTAKAGARKTDSRKPGKSSATKPAKPKPQTRKPASSKAKPAQPKAKASKAPPKAVPQATGRKKAQAPAVKKKPASKPASARSANPPTGKKAAAPAPAKPDKQAGPVKSPPVSPTPAEVSKPSATSDRPVTPAPPAVRTPRLNGSAKHNGRPAPAEEAPDHFEPELTEEQLRKVKTGLKKKDLDEFRSLLLEERSELIGDIEGLDGARTNYGGELANVPLHMADAGSENFDREFMLGMAEHSRKKLRLINEALLRIDKGFFGVCLDSGKPIERARLEFEPWTRYSIEVARHRERLGLTD